MMIPLHIDLPGVLGAIVIILVLRSNRIIIFLCFLNIVLTIILRKPGMDCNLFVYSGDGFVFSIQ